MQYKKLAYVLLWATLVIVCIVPSGCGLFSKPKPELPPTVLPDPATLPSPSGGQVFSVSGETVTVAEVAQAAAGLFKPQASTVSFSEFAFHAKPHVQRIVRAKVSEIMIYQQAKRDFTSEMETRLDHALDNEIRRFVSGFDGDYSAAERELASQGHTWTTFRELQRKQILTQVFVSKQIGEPKPVTRSDLVAFYDSIKADIYPLKPMLDFSVIDIRVPDLKPVPPYEDQQEYAAAIAVDILARLNSGEDFAKLASEFAFSRDQGGRWEPIEPGSLRAPWNAIENECMKMNPGDVSGPVASGDYIFIIKLHEKRLADFEPFENVQRDVEKRLAVDRRVRRFDIMMTRYMDTAKLGDFNDFVDACVQATYRQLQRQLEAAEG